MAVQKHERNAVDALYLSYRRTSRITRGDLERLNFVLVSQPGMNNRLGGVERDLCTRYGLVWVNSAIRPNTECLSFQVVEPSQRRCRRAVVCHHRIDVVRILLIVAGFK